MSGELHQPYYSHLSSEEKIKLYSREIQHDIKALRDVWILEEQTILNNPFSMRIWKTPNGHYLEILTDEKMISLIYLDISEFNGVFKGDHI
jgi:hypothetical protein